MARCERLEARLAALDQLYGQPRRSRPGWPAPVACPVPAAPVGGQVTAREPGTAAGVVKVRLSGAPDDVAAVAALITDYDGAPGIEIIERSAPYPNRRDPGERVYLTVRLAPQGGSR